MSILIFWGLISRSLLRHKLIRNDIIRKNEKGKLWMSEYIHKSHNVSKLMYHFVCPAKYRRVVIDEEVDEVIKETCKEIEKRYEIKFIEIGTDKEHVHFVVQSEQDHPEDKEYNGGGSVHEMSAGEETVVGRGILDEWVLCGDGGRAWE